jgi:hypothetical protein
MTTGGKLRLEVSDYLGDMRKLLDDLSEAIGNDDINEIMDATDAIMERNETLSAEIEGLKDDGNDAA